MSYACLFRLDAQWESTKWAARGSRPSFSRQSAAGRPRHPQSSGYGLPRLEPPSSRAFTQRSGRKETSRLRSGLFHFAFSTAIRAATMATTSSISIAVSRYHPPIKRFIPRPACRYLSQMSRGRTCSVLLQVPSRLLRHFAQTVSEPTLDFIGSIRTASPIPDTPTPPGERTS
jgi:hypothetical protein